MHYKGFLSIVSRRPFRPFRLTLVTGEVFDIHHPDMAIVGEEFVAVGIAPDRGNDEEETEQELIVYWIDLQHVVHIRRLDLK